MRVRPREVRLGQIRPIGPGAEEIPEAIFDGLVDRVSESADPLRVAGRPTDGDVGAGEEMTVGALQYLDLETGERQTGETVTDSKDGDDALADVQPLDPHVSPVSHSMPP